MSKKKKKERHVSNDLLFPIMLILCVMPFVVRLAIYDCGYGDFDWYSSNGEIEDLYQYFRCYFFEIVAVFTSIVLAFYMFLNKEKIRGFRMLWPLGIYGVMVIVSTLMSVNLGASLQGNYYQFQPMLVLLGYLIMFFYTYQVLEKETDYRTIWRGIVVVALLMFFVGGFQIFKKDLLDFAFMQRLVMSEELYSIYGGTMETIFSGNNVYLSLFNPNYASAFLCMMAAVTGVMSYSEQDKKRRGLYLVLFIGILVLMWFTYSRGSIVSFAAAILVFLLVIPKSKGTFLKYFIPGMIAVVAVLVVIDGCNNFKYLNRWVEKPVEQNITSLVTDDQGISLCYYGEDYLVTIDGETPVVYDGKGKQMPLTETEDDYVLETEHPFSMFVSTGEDAELLYMSIDELMFTFTKSEEGYGFRTRNEKITTMRDVEKVDFHGWEYLGSGRVYIWSRTLPLLAKHLLAGSGPDTFAEVYPQDDYLGKAYYAKSTTVIMERPHNDFLLQWVQVGGLACVSLVVFYIFLLIRGGKYFAHCPLDTMKDRLGCGCYFACLCYMVESFFNDSTLFTTPMFWIFAGITLAASYENKH